MTRQRLRKGSVVLVALSCVTVLGMAVAGFLAVSNQSMKLSNRTYAKSVSKQLAEMGLERALRSYNADAFGSNWTLSGTTATLTLTSSSSVPPLPVFGKSGITPSVKIRVENYLAAKKATMWSALTTYAPGDFVWYQGVWYRCLVAATSSEPPSNTTNWLAAPEPWNPYANYRVGNIALAADGRAYRCTADNINQSPPSASWTSTTSGTWSVATAYAVDGVAISGGTAYRCRSAHSGQAPPNTTYWLSAPVIYAEGIATLPDLGATTIKTQLRASLAPSPLFPNAVGASAVVTLGSGGVVDSYNSVIGAYGGSNIGSSAVLAGANPSATGVAITGTRLNGYVAAASASSTPYAPQWSFTSGTAIVTATPAPTVPSPRVDNTRVSRSPSVPQFDLQAVSGSTYNLPSPSSGSILDNDETTALGAPGGIRVYNVTRSMATASSYYSGLYLADTADRITIDGHVIINVTGSYFGMGNGKIIINAGGSLEVYFSSSTQMYLGSFGTGGIDNSISDDPAKVFIASTSATNSLNYHYLQSTVMPFYGTVYLPNAYLTVASNNIPIYGALSAKNVNFTSVANFHYDTALRTKGAIGTFIERPYELSEVRELTDPSEKITFP